jgi:hypothetical protein
MTKRRPPVMIAAIVVAAIAALTNGSGSAAHAVGLDGPESAVRRATVDFGAGLDRVGGYGQDTYSFVEVSGSAEARVWKRLVLGGAASVREDVNVYNDALSEWRGRPSSALAMQAFVGYDGPSFHLSAGPWLYGAKRDRPRFNASVLPYGFLRVRFGRSEGWHVNVRVADGTPFTAAGGGLAFRLMLGAPAWRGHRLTGGLYTSIGEKTIGLTWTDELADIGPAGTAVRWGGLLGCDLDQGFTRPELTGFLGLVW